MFNTALRKKYNNLQLQKLVLTAIVIGLLAAILAVSLKHITEHYEEILFAKASGSRIFFIIFPFAGLSLIYILRHYLFKKKQNKGIKEVFESTATGKKLPAYKIPSHFINGLLTVSFGGSTGIEVSTVVATAAIGSIAHEKESFLKKYKTELICAGITAGITALFTTPLAGLLFAYEVINRKLNKAYVITNIVAASVAFAFVAILGEGPLFTVNIVTWNLYALPYFVLLGVLAGLNSVYLTKCVLYFKKLFAGFSTNYHRIVLGSGLISIMLLILPQLYGDGYHAIKHYIATADDLGITTLQILTIVGIILLKPVITSVTLSAGGDGGVFAPGIFAGAFLGLLTAIVLNTFFNAGVIPVNFMVVGMAAMLSASIHAPFTALFLVCGLINDYTLFVPILLVSLTAKYTAQKIFPYTVYSFAKK